MNSKGEGLVKLDLNSHPLSIVNQNIRTKLEMMGKNRKRLVA